MLGNELVPEPVVVWKDSEQRESNAADGFARLVAETPEDLLDAVDELSPADLEMTVIDLGSASSQDGVVALAAVLVQRGAVAIETRHVVAVNRVFTTHRAIHAGALEVGTAEAAS